MDSKDPQVLNIVGEQVSLLPTGLPKSEPFLIDFDAYYKPPELNETEVKQLKHVLTKVFRKSGAYLGSFSTDLIPTSYPDISGADVAEADVESNEEEKEPMKGGENKTEDKAKEEVKEETKVETEKHVALDLSGALTETADMIVDTSTDVAETVKESIAGAFNPLSIFKPRLPLPPCNEEEKTLLLKSLKYRFSLLRNEITFQREKDSLDFRNAMEHAYRLREYIEFVEKSKECTEDEEERVEYIELDDERIKTLLRQFIFLVLQGYNPLEGYEGIDPGPGAFIQRLEDHAIGDFNKYIEDYRGKDYPIPPRIAEVMKATELDLNAITEQIDYGVKKKMYELLLFIQERIPPEDPFWQNVNKSDMKAVIDALLSVIMAQKDEINRLREELNTKDNQVIALEAKNKQSEEQVEFLKERIVLIQGEVEAAKSLANSKGTNSVSLSAALENAQKEIEALKANIVELENQKKQCEQDKINLQTEIDRLRDQVRGLETKLPELESAAEQMEKLREANAKLQEELAALKKDCEDKSELTARLATLQQELETAQKNKSDLETELASLKTGSDDEKKNLLKQIDDLKEVIAALEVEADKTEELTQQISDLQSQLTSLETKKAEEGTNAQEKIGSLEAELERVKAESSGLLEQIKDLNNQVADRDENLEEVLKNIDSLVQELGIAKERIQTLEKEADDWKQQLASAQSEIADLTRRLRDAEKKAAAFEASDSQAAQEVERLRGELNERIANLEEQLASKENELQGEKDAKQKIIDDLNAQIRALTQQLESSSSKSSAQEGTLSELQTKLQAAEEGIKQKDIQISELEALRKQLSDANAKISDLIKLRERDLKRFQAELAAKEEAMRKECDEKLAAASGTSAQEVAAIKQRFEGEKEQLIADYNNTLAERDASMLQLQNELAADKAEIQTLRDKILSIVKWMEGDAEKPEFTENTSDRSTLEPLISSIDKALSQRQRSPSISAQQSQALRTEIRRNYCYLMFFASYTMSQYFPIEGANENIKNIIYDMLNGIPSRKVVDLYDVHGYYKEVGGENPIKDLLDMFIKILQAMEGGTTIISVLKPDQVKKMEILQTLLPKILQKRNMSTEVFDSLIHQYHRAHSGVVENPAENLYIKFSADTLTVVEKEENLVLSYPFLFYVFLFIVRDYLNQVEGELKQCPLPQILKK